MKCIRNHTNLLTFKRTAPPSVEEHPLIRNIKYIVCNLQTAQLEEKEALIVRLTDKIAEVQVSVAQHQVDNDLMQGKIHIYVIISFYVSL